MALPLSKKTVALGLLIVPVLLNEWTLGPLVAADGVIDGPKLWVVRGFDVGCLIAAALVFLVKLNIAKLYQTTAIMVFNTLLLFVGLNLVAWAFTSHYSLRYAYSALEFIREQPDQARAIYGLEDLAAIEARVYSPGAVAHPSLPLQMRPATGPYYTSGTFGERLSCRDGKPFQVADINDAIWMFGGSTTYGSGVADCETIATALNGLTGDVPVINFGVESFGRPSETQRLILLLRQGYRPRAVVFFDGLNDIDINIMRAPLLPVQTVPPTVATAYYHQLLNDSGSYYANLFGRLPLAEVMGSFAAPDAAHIIPCTIDPLEAGLNQPGNAYHDAPLTHFGRQMASTRALRALKAEDIPPEHLERCGERLVRFYQGEMAFTNALAEAFNFQTITVFQPIGGVNLQNPFYRDPETFFAGSYHAFLKYMVELVRQEIAQGRL
ncbi:MAG: hypothetical protein ACPGYL_06325, partial [Rhodospirillaceae bacterium]